MARGSLRIHLGAAPGAGTTRAMLRAAHERAARGTGPVLAAVPDPDALPAGLERVPPGPDGALDLDALLARRPHLAVVPGLARPNPPGARHPHRWQDVEALLDAGIDVLTTLHVLDLESLSGTVQQITGTRPAHTVPDEVVRRAERIELVDADPAGRWDTGPGDAGGAVGAGAPGEGTPGEGTPGERAPGGDAPGDAPDVGARHRVPPADAAPGDGSPASPEAEADADAPGNAAAPAPLPLATLTALRELALLWTAGRVHEDLRRHRAGLQGAVPATARPPRERVVVGLTGGPEGATLLRRAARSAACGAGGELLAVHVVRSRGAGAGAPPPAVAAEQRRLVEELGGSYHTVLGEDVATALLDFARGAEATRIVLGSSRRGTWQRVLGPGVGATVAREAGPIDVHIVSHEHAATVRPRLPGRLPVKLGRRRAVAGWLLGCAGPPLLTVALAPGAGNSGLPTALLLFLTLTVGAALAGGVFPAIAAALLGSLLLNFFFAPPTHTFTISNGRNLLALLVFVAVGIAVASVVDLAARRAQQAARGRAESEVLAALAMAAALPVEGAEGDPPGGAAGAPGASAEPGPGAARDESATRGATPYATPPPSGRTPTAAPYGAPAAPAAGDGIDALLARVRETFAVDSAALLERTGEPGRTVWRRAAAVGAGAAGRPEEADVEVPVGERLVLALNGRVLPAEDRRLLGAFAAQTAALLERRRLAAEAVRARRLAEGNRIRTALLAAVSHDLRTPLAGIKAAVSSLRGEEVEWSPQDEAELLAAIEAGADRLDHLIGNLLDMSRLHTGTVSPLLRDVGLDEVVPAALAELPAGSVQLDVPEHLPRVRVDPGLLERAVANVVENAVKHSPAGTPVTVRAAPAGGAWVELRVVDHGPGVPEEARARIFEPFQRFGDTARGTGAGVGLGLAVARGFTEAMGGTLAARATSGGGLTMVLTLPVSDPGPGSPGSPDSPGSPGEDCTERDDEGQARR